MGCFNVSCGISHLSINCGDEVYLYLLLKNLDNYYESTTKYFYEIDDLYKPFCFPIKGIYNDYGSIENIEKNENTKALEKYFNMSIEDIVKTIDGGNEILENLNTNAEILSNLNLMFIKSEVYEYLTSLNISTNKPLDVLELDLTRCILLKHEFYEYREFFYKNDKINDLIVNLNKNIITYDNLNYNFYNYNDFLKIINKVKNINIKKIDESVIDIYFNNLFDAFKTIDNYNENDNDFKLSLKKFSFEGFLKNLNLNNFIYLKEIYELDCFNNLLKFKKEISEYYYLQLNMYNTNHLFQPALLGPQSGDLTAEINLNKKIEEILKK